MFLNLIDQNQNFRSLLRRRIFPLVDGRVLQSGGSNLVRRPPLHPHLSGLYFFLLSGIGKKVFNLF